MSGTALRAHLRATVTRQITPSLPRTYVHGLAEAAQILGVSERTMDRLVAERHPALQITRIFVTTSRAAFSRNALHALRERLTIQQQAERPAPRPRPQRATSATRDIVRLIDQAAGPITLQAIYLSTGCAHEQVELSRSLRNLELRKVLAVQLVDRPTGTGRKRVKGYSKGANFSAARERHAMEIPR